MATISQLPAEVTLRKFRGDEFRVTLDFDIDLTGYTFSSDIYAVAIVPTGAGVGVTTTTTSVGSFVITPISLLFGQLALSLDETASNAITGGNYRWYLRWVSPLGETRTVLNGPFEVVNDLTQATGTNTDGAVISTSVSTALPTESVPLASGLISEIVWG